MSPHRVLRPSDPAYPTRLLELGADTPGEISLSGELGPGLVVGIVGTRAPTPEAERFTLELAAAVGACGAVVVSGGAIGIDAAAHRGALRARGRTWVVAPTGSAHVFPSLHDELYTDVRRRGGTMIWPFPFDESASLPTFFRRNGVLAALADLLVVVQAGARSGALNAAKWARRLNRPVWTIGSPPWDERYAGCRGLIDRGARPIASIKSFLINHALALPPRRPTRPEEAMTLNWVRAPTQPNAAAAALAPVARPRLQAAVARSSLAATLDVNGNVVNQIERRQVVITATSSTSSGKEAARTLASAGIDAESDPCTRPLPPLDPTELALLEATAHLPRHLDEIAVRARVCTSAAATGLLTLALENVVVEGPEGFFRRGN